MTCLRWSAGPHRKLKGLPYSATEQDIRNFFDGFEILGVHWVSEPDGRPSGLVRVRETGRPMARLTRVWPGSELKLTTSCCPTCRHLRSSCPRKMR